jgi:alpha-tubulin suppressor-like RCC1 family protein
VFVAASSGQYAVFATNGCNITLPTIAKTNYTFTCNKPPKLYGIGSNHYGQLGNTSYTQTSIMLPVNMDGALANKYVVDVKTGLGFTAALTMDGKVFVWGNNTACKCSFCNHNDTGALGTGPTNVTAGEPVEVYTQQPSALYMQFVVSIACGSRSCIALTTNNDLVQWGTIYRGDPPNEYNSTIFGLNSTFPIPTLVHKGCIGTRTISQIAMGSFHALVLTTDNRMFSWGANAAGQIGDGTTVSKFYAVSVQFSLYGSKTIGKITAGGNYSLVMSTDGLAYGWGGVATYTVSGDGSLLTSGDGTAVIKKVPTALQLYGRKVSSISASFTNAGVVTINPYALTLGDNSMWQVGDETVSTAYSATGGTIFDNNGFPFNTNEKFVAIYSGTGMTFVKTSAGRILMYGDATAGFCGATYPNSVAASNCLMYSPGRNLVFSYVVPQNQKPVLVGGTVSNFAIFVTDGCEYPFSQQITRSIASDCQYNLYSWGYNVDGALNDGTTINRPSAVLFNNSLFEQDPLVEIRQGYSFFVGLTSSGTLYGWGYKGGVPISGIDSNSAYAQPYPAPIPAGNDSALFQQSIVSVRCGDSSCIALRRDNILVGWGSNQAGEIGDGTNIARPLPVPTLRGKMGDRLIAAIEMGGQHCLVLTTDNGLFTWGNGLFGRLGLGDTTSYYLPMNVYKGSWLMTKTISKIAAGGTHNIVLVNDNMNMYGWGMIWREIGARAGCGDNTVVDKTTPVIISSGYGPITAIATGYYNAMTVQTSGYVCAMGDNTYGQVDGNPGGVASYAAFYLCTYFDFLSGERIVGIGMTSRVIAYVTTKGRLLTAGRNDYGGLGYAAPGAISVSSAPGHAFTTFPVTQVYGSNPQMSGSVFPSSFIVASPKCSPPVFNVTTSMAAFTCQQPNELYRLTDSGYTLINTSFVDGFVVETTKSDYFLTSTGKVYNTVAQLYTGQFTSSPIVALACADIYACLMIARDNTLLGFGPNTRGGVGDGTTTARSLPVQVVRTLISLRTITSVHVTAQSFVLTSDGRLYGWGANSYGGVGDNSQSQKNIPVWISTNFITRTVSKVFPGLTFTMAIASDGGLYAWGGVYTVSTGTYSMIGDNTVVRKYVPTLISAGYYSSKTFIAGTSSSYFALALASDGNILGLFDVGTTSSSRILPTGDGTNTYPVSTTYKIYTNFHIVKNVLDAGEKIVALTSAGYGNTNGYDSFYFRTNAGRVLAFGTNIDGSMGLFTPYSIVGFIPDAVTITIPGRRISSIGNLIATDGCSYDTVISVVPSSCGVDNDIYGFGDNTKYQIDAISNTTRPAPTMITGIPKNIITVASATNYGVALTNDGLLYAWGANNMGTFITLLITL